MLHAEAIGTTMKKTVQEGPASGSTVLLVLLSASVISCTGPTAPDAPEAPVVSAELARTSSPFSYSRTISVNDDRRPLTDLSDFPVLISGTFDGRGNGSDRTPDLRTTANGGKVQSASGYDVGFYTEKDCSTGKLSWETEQYSAATGEVAYWVRVPAVYHDKNTVFYLCYGNSGITTDQSSPASVWDAGYLAVWHLADHGGLDLSSSTANSFPFTNSGPVAAAPGKIGGGTNKFLDATYYLDNASVSIPADGAVTISLWKKLLAADDYPANPEVDGNHISFALGASHDDPNSMTLWAPYFLDVFWYYALEGPSSQNFGVDYSGYYDRWAYITVVYDPAADRLKALYLDGSLVGSTTNGPTTSAPVTGFRIGQSRDDHHGPDPSQFDEVRISSTARSADWIKTEFNNQNDPASFYRIGPEKRFR
jgi:hypothetical protein